MTASNYAEENVREHLAMADRLFSDGNNDQAAMCLYRAVVFAMKLAAEWRGQECEGEEDMHALALNLDEEYGPPGWHVTGVATACAFHDNAQLHYLDYDDLLDSRPLVRDLVEQLVKYRNGG